ncbi:hypothetical protein FPV67DRAFT_1037792 [Lyophyllum atratum]|nr:hypothetical protein FPV67DRAFT_1037792 [Lyophyllum atratum]
MMQVPTSCYLRPLSNESACGKNTSKYAPHSYTTIRRSRRSAVTAQIPRIGISSVNYAFGANLMETFRKRSPTLFQQRLHSYLIVLCRGLRSPQPNASSMTPQQLLIVATLAEEIERMKVNRSNELVNAEGDAVLQIKELDFRRTINSFTPACALPMELLSRVFELGQAMEWEELADAAETTSDDASSTHQPFEILVTHVSSHFRNVAIGTHLLWSRITVSPAFRGAEIETYLARSNGCGLGVRMELGGVRTPNSQTMQKANMVALHSRRYQRFAIESSRESVARPIIRRLCNVTTPLLQHLSVSVDEVEGSNVIEDQMLQGGAPVLAFVRLRGVALPLFLPPLGNVTTLHLDQTTALPVLYTTFRNMLTTPSLLTNLSIFGDIIPENITLWPGIASPISLPHLRCLRICGVGGTIYSGLLLGIIAPALESLVLKNLKERDLERFCAAPLHTLCFPLLRNLTVLDSEVSRDVYTELFRGFTAISTFTTAYHMMAHTMLLLLSMSGLQLALVGFLGQGCTPSHLS